MLIEQLLKLNYNLKDIAEAVDFLINKLLSYI